MRSARAAARLLWLIAAAGALPAAAQAPARELTAYAARGLDSDLPDLPGRLVRGNLPWEDARFLGAGYLHPLDGPAWAQAAFDALAVPRTRIGVEAVWVQHRGRQTNAEAAVALALRFAGWQPGPLALRAGVGFGLSYALGTPTYEDGARSDPARRYRLQNFNAYEVELGLRALANWGVVARVHHRSGIFGLIAPRGVGSNFIALGLRGRF